MSVDQPVPPRARRAGPPFRPSMRGSFILLALLAIVAIYATDQIVPATSDREAKSRLSLAVSAGGNVALVLLAVQVSLGLILSHPTNTSTWKLSKLIFPWHANLWVFVMASVVVHVGAIVLDPFARVSIIGAVIPGLSSYRSVPVALGTLAIYAFLITALTAEYARRLPPRVWLTIHRLSLIVFVLAWLHVFLVSGQYEEPVWLYAGTALAVLLSGLYRVWASRLGRPSFTTLRVEASHTGT
jgi:predicted ferric reductase